MNKRRKLKRPEMAKQDPDEHVVFQDVTVTHV